MITVTPAAATQILNSAQEGNMEETPLRLAVTELANGQFQYAMGFDDRLQEGDQLFDSNKVSVVVNASSLPLLTGTTLDFIELEPGQFHFAFMNPNDPNYIPPTE